MKATLLLFAIAIATVLASGDARAAGAGPKEPPESILGLRLGMSEEDALRALGKVGQPDPERRGLGDAKQFWKLRDRRYAWLAVRFDGDRRVEWITAFTHPGRRSVRYRDIADLEQAKQQGSYIFTWWVAEREDQAAPYAVTARGSDPEYLSSLSLYRP